MVKSSTPACFLSLIYTNLNEYTNFNMVNALQNSYNDVIFTIKFDVIWISDLIKPDLLDAKGAIIYEYVANGQNFTFGAIRQDETDGPGINQVPAFLGPYEQHLPNELSAPTQAPLYSEHHTSEQNTKSGFPASKVKIRFVHHNYCYRDNLKSYMTLQSHFAPQQ